MDMVFPPSPAEKMTAGEFSAAALPCENQPDGAFALFNYNDKLVKRAIWELKFLGNRNVARLFAEILYEEMLAQTSEISIFYGQSKPFVVPMPSHPKRLREKGFNQTELMADRMSFIGGGYFEINKNVLYKIKDTPPQFSIKDRSGRLSSQKGVFAVKNKEIIRGKIIILFDDVVTTGTTMGEAREVLQKAGAKKVVCFALAH